MDIYIYIKFFIGLVALVNPIGILPVFISMTGYQDAKTRNKTNLTANVSVGVILTVSLLFGGLILQAFGISIPSFQVAGGIVVVIVALSMVNGRIGDNQQSQAERLEMLPREHIGVVPLALPLMAGPGAISAMVVWSTHYPGWVHLLGFVMTTFLFSCCCWLLFRSAPIITRILGQVGVNVVTRIMGLLLMALGIEIMVSGLKAIFLIG